MLLEVVLARGGELHGNELEATVLEARDDGANESTLVKIVSLMLTLDAAESMDSLNGAMSVPGHHRA